MEVFAQEEDTTIKAGTGLFTKIILSWILGFVVGYILGTFVPSLLPTNLLGWQVLTFQSNPIAFIFGGFLIGAIQSLTYAVINFIILSTIIFVLLLIFKR